MSAHTSPIFDVDVFLPSYAEIAGNDLDSIDRELDFRQQNRNGITDPLDQELPVFAGSLTCGNSCGVLSVGCGSGGGCGGATCQCTNGCTNGCSDGCDFTNGCDFGFF